MSAKTIWSGKRDSNSRPRPWQGRALPTELFPREPVMITQPGRQSSRSLKRTQEPHQSVASEGRLRVAGAQEPQCTRQYMRIPSTAGAQAAERSSFAEVLAFPRRIHL